MLQACGCKDMDTHHSGILDISVTPRSGFETKANVDCKKWPFDRVVAVFAEGLMLRTSEAVETFCEEEEPSALGSMMANGNVRMGSELVDIMVGAVLV